MRAASGRKQYDFASIGRAHTTQDPTRIGGIRPALPCDLTIRPTIREMYTSSYLYDIYILGDCISLRLIEKVI